METLPFYLPELSRQSNELGVDSAKTTLELLNSPVLKDEIEDGNVTLAMIRPKVGPDANVLNLSDQEAADEIEQMIQYLGVIAKFSLQLTPKTIQEFYQGGPQESMLKEAPLNPNRHENRWPEFIEFMSSGPTTILLLHSPRGDAIPKWRDHLGHWNIDEVRDAKTIRGRLGVNKYNNLVHGSDAPESVLRELGIISKQLVEITESKDEAKQHVLQQMKAFYGNTPETIWLKQKGLIRDIHEAYKFQPGNDWKRLGGETYVMDFVLHTEDSSHHLIAKACIKIPPSEVMNEWTSRRYMVEKHGINTPTLYAIEKATLLEEFVPYSLREAYEAATPEVQNVLKERFYETYKKLCELGFKPMSMHDVRSHGEDIVLIDFGEDLGGIFTKGKLPKGIDDNAQTFFQHIV